MINDGFVPVPNRFAALPCGTRRFEVSLTLCRRGAVLRSAKADLPRPETPVPRSNMPSLIYESKSIVGKILSCLLYNCGAASTTHSTATALYIFYVVRLFRRGGVRQAANAGQLANAAGQQPLDGCRDGTNDASVSSCLRFHLELLFKNERLAHQQLYLQA
jgi:hypothetical protein